MNGNGIYTITHAGIIFLVYMALMIMLYFLLSPAVDAMFAAFTGSHFGLANEEMAQFVPNYLLAVKMAFALGFAAPITWFIFWVFSREPAQYSARFR